MRWRGLDGVRALAVLAVLGFHFAPGAVPGGFLGVDVFFVLSGYLITRMIVTEYGKRDGFGFVRFYLRRARRLLPGVAVVLLAALAAAAFWRDQLLTVRQAALAAAGYVSNWWLSYVHQSYFVSAGRPSMLQHLWSLAVEEQFYLLWPLIAVFVLARSRGRRWVLPAVAVVLALASTTETLLLALADRVPYSTDASRLYYGTDTHSMGLLLGAAIGAAVAGRRKPARIDVASEARRRVPEWASDLVAAAALGALLVLVLGASEDDAWLYRGGFLAVAALTGLATAAVARPRSRLGRVLDMRPMRWLAARSYAIYLWHWPIAVVTRPGVDLHWPVATVFVLRVPVTLVLADITYRCVERPIRQIGIRPALRAGRARLGRVLAGRAPVGARLASAALATLVLLAGSVLVVGPRASLSAGQRTLAAEHGGGRDLPLGRPRTVAPPITDLSPVAHVASGIATEMPRTAPSAPAPVTTTSMLPQVSAYGDSVMLGARPALDARFPGGRMNAVEGRQPDPILSDVESDARSGRLYPLVIIGVGDNGLITPSRLRHALAQLRSVPRVIVINNRVGRPWEAPNNHAIARIAPRFPNVRLLDWHARSAGHPNWFVDDRIHLTAQGAAAYSALIVSAARSR